jgi:hypothetical protein
MFRTIVGRTALILGLLLSLNVAATAACEDGGCPTAAKAKPLDIMQFMREQAASTRVAKPRRDNLGAAAKAQRPARRAIAARPKPAGLPTGASASFASQPDPAVQVTASDELNAIDRAAAPAPAETVGAAIAAEPDVRLVDAEEFNDIDRKADDRSPPPTSMAIADAHATDGSSSASWPQRIWSALGSLFGALATAVHQLTGLSKVA